jgi:hypothetical protein
VCTFAQSGLLRLLDSRTPLCCIIADNYPSPNAVPIQESARHWSNVGSVIRTPLSGNIDGQAGIGEALAEKLVSEGSFVIVTGRRKENLDKFVEKYGSDKAEAVEFDISDLDSIPKNLSSITKAHDDIDCIILNAGIQRRSGK